jgi:AraC family transcriptional regulator, ethanolamine operon transcriptional activator
MPRESDVAVGLPAVTIVEISDLTIANEGIELFEQDAIPLQSTPLRARRIIVRLEGAAVLFHSTNLRVRTRTRSHSGLVGYVTFGQRATGTANGLPITPDLMLAAESETEVGFVAEAGYESVAILVPPDDLRSHLAVRQRVHDFRMPQGVEVLQVNALMARRLFRLGKRLVETAARRPALFNERKDQRSAAQVELLEALLAALGTARDIEPSRDDESRQAQSHIVRIAEDYALAHSGEYLYVTDLCRTAAVSERALEYAFKRVMGMTPVAYLTRLRLHRVRKALLTAQRGSTTVSTEALKWGFWHFGEFTRAYKACFSERPSDTLRQRSSHSRTSAA